MTQINPNINNMPPQMQQNIQNVPQPVQLPSYYYVPATEAPHNFKEAMEANPMSSMAYDMTIKQFVEHPIYTLGLGAGLGLGIDAYAKANRGDYDKSLVKKVANFGDKIQESKIVQSKPVQTIIGWFKSAGNAGKKVVNNSAVLRAMRDTPSMPEWSTVKAQMYNQKQEIVQDFVRIVDGLKLTEEQAPKLKNIGIDKAEKEMLKKVFKVANISSIPETQAVNQVLLHRLGKTSEEIKAIQALGDKSTAAVKKEILNAMGMDANKIKLIKEDVFGQYVDDVINATKKVKGRVKIGLGHFGWMGPLTKPFERTIGCDEVYNKLFSLSKGGAKTATGRFMSHAMQILHRGLTFGGGKLGAYFFIAPFLLEPILNARKADKDQKVGTVANGIVENISWVFTFPLALKIMHSFGGIQYAGMTKEQVEQYRNIKQNFKNAVKEGKYADKATYKAAKQKCKDELKTLSNIKGQNIFTKGLRNLARFFTIDLETMAPRKTGNVVMDTLRKTPNFFKNVAGVPMRFAAWQWLSMGVLGAALTKCTTMIFGKSYDAMKQDERKEEKKEQKQFLKEDLNRRLYALAEQKAVNQKQNAYRLAKTQSERRAAPYTSKGLNENSKLAFDVKPEEISPDNYTYIPSQENIIPSPVKADSVDNYTYIPSSDCKIQPESAEGEGKQKRYIPSQEAANISKTFDNSGIQDALARAQRAEDKALKILAGNFEGMQ